MVALLVDAKLMRIPVRLEVTPEGKVGHVFVRLVIEGLCVCQAVRGSHESSAFD